MKSEIKMNESVCVLLYADKCKNILFSKIRVLIPNKKYITYKLYVDSMSFDIIAYFSAFSCQIKEGRQFTVKY